MPDLRSPSHDLIDEHRERSLYDTSAADWLTLPQAACELGISVSTARRLIRQGRLRNRIVPRRGGFAYLVHVPDSRHASLLADCQHERAPAAPAAEPALADRIQTLEEQVDNLSAALSRALRRSAPEAEIAQRAQPRRNAVSPYAQYRSAVRGRRWWPF